MHALKMALDDFMEPDPYRLGRRVKKDGRRFEWYLIKYSLPPSRVGLLVGDAVHNLRSALDHIAYALAEDGAAAIGHTMTGEERADIQFPTCINLNQFQSQIGRGRLRFVEATPHALIELYQPYNLLGQDPEHAIPRVLSDLDNTDKHRVIHTASEVMSYAMASRPRPYMERFTKLTDWELGTVILTRAYVDVQSEMDVEFSPEFSLTIEGAWPPNRTPEDVLEIYADWIESFILGQLEIGADARSNLHPPTPPNLTPRP
jgi:hypothetical protein